MWYTVLCLTYTIEYHMNTEESNLVDITKLPRMPVSMTIKPILIRELKAEAKREGRTVSNLVERIIEQHLAGQKQA